jgi:hypothetical protein
VIVLFSYLPLFEINSELFTFTSRTMFVIMDPTGNLVLICKTPWTLLRGSLMHTFDPLCDVK